MITASPLPYACPVPTCRCPLDRLDRDGFLVCQSCRARYPVLMGAVPILVADPGAHLSRQALELARGQKSLRERIDSAAESADIAPELADAFMRQAAALGQNLELIDRIQACLLQHLSPAALLAAAADMPSRQNSGPKPEYGSDQIWAYLRRDWGGEPESELEVTSIAEAVLLALRGRDLPAAPILVLGAGVGRIANIVAQAHEQTIALEFSLPFSIAHQLLLDGPLQVNVVGRRNRRSATDVVRTAICTRTPSGSNSRAPTWVVADAGACPFVEGYFGAVVSCYFSDVLKPSIWLPEMLRVLAPGGYFIHVGPLGFHFDVETEQLSADLFARLLERHGLAIRSTDWLLTTYLAAPEQLSRSSCDNLVLVAEKARRPSSDLVHVDHEAIPGIVGAPVVEVKSCISNVSRSVESCVVRVADGGSCTLSELGSLLLESIDGETTVGALLARLGDHLGTGALPGESRAEVYADLEKLVAIGAVRLARAADI